MIVRRLNQSLFISVTADEIRLPTVAALRTYVNEKINIMASEVCEEFLGFTNLNVDKVEDNTGRFTEKMPVKLSTCGGVNFTRLHDSLLRCKPYERA